MAHKALAQPRPGMAKTDTRRRPITRLSEPHPCIIFRVLPDQLPLIISHAREGANRREEVGQGEGGTMEAQGRRDAETGGTVPVSHCPTILRSLCHSKIIGSIGREPNRQKLDDFNCLLWGQWSLPFGGGEMVKAAESLN